MELISLPRTLAMSSRVVRYQPVLFTGSFPGTIPTDANGNFVQSETGISLLEKENSHVYDGLFGISVPHTDLQLDVKKKIDSMIRHLRCKPFVKHWHFQCGVLQLHCATVCFKEHGLGFLSSNPVQILILNNKFLDASLRSIPMGASYCYTTTFWALYDTPLWCA